MTAEPWSRVSVIIVTRNSAAVIEACLEGVVAAERVIVVDNASDDDTLAIVSRLRPDADIIRNNTGLGFGTASNQGLDRVETEFALHINPDTTMHRGAVEALVAVADRYPETGLLGPRLVNPNGGTEKSYDFARHRRHGMSENREGEAIPDGPCCTWFLQGAVLFHRMSALRKVGLFDPAIFLYFEDDDICARFIEQGFTLLYVPDAVASHAGGGSVRMDWKAIWDQHYHFEWSGPYYEAKHNGTAAAARLTRRRLGTHLRWLLICILTGRFKDAYRLFARVIGGLAYLLRIPASKTTRRARPEPR
jgi:GT2 family glycosyltransferase